MNMNQAQPNYTWNGILQYLHKHHEQQLQKQSLWFLEKKQFQDHIKQLQARATSLESINSDLLNRNRMLQHCLRNMKGQQKNQNHCIKQEIPKLPQRRPKPNKDQISKILYSLGVKNLIENIQKDIHEKVPNSQLNLDLQKSNTFRQKQNNLNEIRSSVYKEIQSLQGHQDGVRDLHFLDQNKLLASVSEDCTLKIWNVKNPSNTTCLGTIREHSGPVFTVIQCENYALTGGMQGIIRCWNFENVQEKKDVGRKNLIGSWMNSEEDKLQPIWQLVYSPQNKLVFSTSSEIAIKAYKVDTSEGMKAEFKKSYIYTDNSNIAKEQQDIPTAICLHQNKLVAGYVTSHSLVHFDIQTGKIFQQMVFDAEGQISTNKIISHPNMLLGAFEDKMVRIFDKNRMTYSFKAHDDSVMSLSLLSNMNQFFTCGHDGLVKLWDLRKFQAISVFKAHDKKYDESVHCLTTSSHSLAASGGADSIIKIFGV